METFANLTFTLHQLGPQSSIIYLIIPSVIVLLLSLPLNLVFFVGSLKAARIKEASIIDGIIVFYSLAILQNCFVSQISLVLRSLAWHSDSISSSVMCTVTQVSVFSGGCVFHVGLTVVVILRYVYVCHPAIGHKIQTVRKTALTAIAFFLTGLSLFLGLADVFWNKQSIVRLCQGTLLSSTGDRQPEYGTYDVQIFLAVTVCIEAVLIARIIRHSNKTVPPPMANLNRSIQQRNLLTLRGCILCRFVSLLPSFVLVIILQTIPPESDSFDEYVRYHVFLLCYYVLVVVGVPLCSILCSPFIRNQMFEFESFPA